MRVVMEVNGHRLEAEEGESVLQALHRAGLVIPSLCHTPLLQPTGACRLCVVEMKARGESDYRTATACDTLCADGLQIQTDTDRIRQARRGVLSLLLQRAPDAAALQALAGQAGMPPPVVTDQTPDRPDTCILCRRCVRVCCDVVGAGAISLSGRGVSLRIASPFDEESPRECIACGACATLCPTGFAKKFPVARLQTLAQATECPRPCRYALMGLLPDAVCTANYQCATCDIHQLFQRRAGQVHPVFLKKGGRVHD